MHFSLHGRSNAALAEPKRRDGAAGGAHAREMTRVVAAVAQQQLVFAVSDAAHLACHELDRWARAVPAHLPRACAAVVQ